MVIRKSIGHRARERGVLIVEAVVALAIFLIAILPLALGMLSDARLLRVTYEREAAIEIVDGEAEILAAGGGRQLAEGTNRIPIHAAAAVNLPDGRFVAVRHSRQLRVEWIPAGKSGVGQVTREVTLK